MTPTLTNLNFTLFLLNSVIPTNTQDFLSGSVSRLMWVRRSLQRVSRVPLEGGSPSRLCLLSGVSNSFNDPSVLYCTHSSCLGSASGFLPSRCRPCRRASCTAGLTPSCSARKSREDEGRRSPSCFDISPTPPIAQLTLSLQKYF